MTTFPIDLALTLAAAGIDVNLDEDAMVAELRGAIADRGGYVDGPELGDVGWRVGLLAPARMTFEGRSAPMALAWCLVYLMGERGEIGARGYAG